MILAIDIGATKTLLASVTNEGKISYQNKFPTPKKYSDFIAKLKELSQEHQEQYKIGVVAAPGHIDRESGIASNFGNLPWTEAPLKTDLEPIFNCHITVENDTKLAGLSEAIYIKKEFKVALYITISTGISGALVVDGVLDPELKDSEGGHILLEQDGKLQTWESIASGRSIYAKYGMKASDITDPEIWDEISYNIARGLYDLLAVIQPDVVVIGGGVGTHFKKYEKPLLKHLKTMEVPLVPIPPILGAKHAEEAVIYGCYYLGRTLYAKSGPPATK